MVFCCCCRCCRCLSCCLGMVSMSLPATCLCCGYCECPTRDACSTWHGGYAVFVACLCCLFLLIVFVDPGARVVGDPGHDLPYLLEASCWGMASCLFWRTGIAAIDAPATIIVVVQWVLSWYSQRPHNALVVFVGKAALWHQGRLLPWPPLLRASWSSQEALASLVENDIDSADIAIGGDGVIDCRCLLQLCLVLTLTLRSRLDFDSLITIRTEYD